MYGLFCINLFLKKFCNYKITNNDTSIKPILHYKKKMLTKLPIKLKVHCKNRTRGIFLKGFQTDNKTSVVVVSKTIDCNFLRNVVLYHGCK